MDYNDNRLTSFYMSLSSIEESKKLHAINPDYSAPSAYSDQGTLKGSMRLPFALKKACSCHPMDSFLDYGCGQNGLVDLLEKDDNFKRISFSSYDPAVAKFAGKPARKFDILTCIDVLEHIPRGEIFSVLRDINDLTRGFFFFAIDLCPAKKTLSDCRNAHILLAPADWWCQQISAQFSYARFFQAGTLESGEKFPVHLFGWAANSASHQKMANLFFDSIEIFSKEWICGSENFLDIRLK